MKILRKIRTSALVLCITLFLALVSVATGIPFTALSVNAIAEETQMTYIDAEVERIAFIQHPTCVYFGFELTESDYDDFKNWEGDYGGTTTYHSYENYLRTQLTYWENFSQMNSEGVRFDQLYAYWSAGLNPATHTHALPASTFNNTVAHRSTLARLEYGFTISIPAGTTFPCAEYVKGELQGTPVAYRTTEDKAFYYDGSNFVVFSYSIYVERAAAVEEINSIDYNAYFQEEQTIVLEIVKNADAALNESFSSVAVQDALSAFYAELSEVMTIADYEALATAKETAKTELSIFFNSFSQTDYEDAEWEKVLSIQNEYNTLLDGLKSISAVEAAAAGVKLAADKVLTKAEQTEFSDYKTTVSQKVKEAFVESLYRGEERAQGNALVDEAVLLIESATTYDEVDGVALTYIANLNALKTAAQWEEEEQSKPNDSTDNSSQEENSQSEKTDSNESGCNGSVTKIEITFGIAAIAILMIINKKRKGIYNEK